MNSFQEWVSVTLGSGVFCDVAIAFVVGVGVVLANSILIVAGNQIAILERRWIGRKLPEGRVVAMSDEVGIQARTLGPGLHVLFPFLYKIQKRAITEIAQNEIGLIEAIDGVPLSSGRIFARGNRDSHQLFQDGEAFLRNGGEKGPQIDVLPPGMYRINPYLFRIQKMKAIEIGNNKIGIVVAADGMPVPMGRLLGSKVEGHGNFQDANAFLENGGQKGPQLEILLPGTYRIHPGMFQVAVHSAVVIPTKKVGLVTARDGAPLPTTEYVACSVAGHRDFQDSAGFLNSGGQRGPQLDFLKPGTYYINPLLFEVALDDVLLVQRGEVSAIVSNIGKDPVVGLLNPAASFEGFGGTESSGSMGTESGVDRYVVGSGYRGIQKEVLGPGTYYLNKLAFTSHLIPTTNITIDWAEEGALRKVPRVFNPLSIVSHDGFEMTVEVKVIIRVQPEQVPQMVARIGTIDNLIEHVIHPLIDSSFRNQASSAEAMKFMQDRHEEQSKAEKHVADELRRYHVECVSVLICQITLPERLMQTMTDKVVAVQQMSMFDAQQEAEGRRREMEKIKAQANLQPNLVKAEIDVQIAAQQKQQEIILAEGKSQSIRLEQEGIAAGVEAVGRAEGEKIRAIGQATSEAYSGQVGALGAPSLSMIEVMKQIAAGNVKITPEIWVQGSGGKGENGDSQQQHVLSAFMSSLMLGKTGDGVRS
jgi:regulator of protease activity HflC (stomatin/prohibitin superfamily)